VARATSPFSGRFNRSKSATVCTAMRPASYSAKPRRCCQSKRGIGLRTGAARPLFDENLCWCHRTTKLPVRRSVRTDPVGTISTRRRSPACAGCEFSTPMLWPDHGRHATGRNRRAATLWCLCFFYAAGFGFPATVRPATALIRQHGFSAADQPRPCRLCCFYNPAGHYWRLLPLPLQMSAQDANCQSPPKNNVNCNCQDTGLPFPA